MSLPRFASLSSSSVPSSIPASTPRESLMWSQFAHAASSFCMRIALQNAQKDRVVCALVGEELEWCGGHSYLFMASRYIDSSTRAKDLEIRCENAEAGYITEQTNASSLRKQLKSSQMLAEDSEWQLQEQLAHSNNMISLEQQNVSELMNKVTELSHKLTEVEMYLDSDRGRITMQMEEELAETKLKLAELEAERDEHEIEKNGLSAFNMNKLNLPLKSNSQSQQMDKHVSSPFDDNENQYERNKSLIYSEE